MTCKRTARPKRHRGESFLATLVGASALALRAEAEPLRLRADAIADTQSPTGLVVLQGQDKVRPWLDAEGLVWAGARPDAAADVLTLSVRLREPHGLAELRAGRQVIATGAVRPVQIDGGSAIGRAPWGSKVEAFAGAPVVPRFASRPYDWLAGGRFSQSVASMATLGVSYVQRRSYGEIADEELGADFAAAPARWLDLAAFSAYDLTSPGIADARVSAATRVDTLRLEAFASQRSPSRLLPATSLFSVLGDFPSQMVGGTLAWKAAPRLDVLASGAGQDVAGELGGNAALRTTLRLDDQGDGKLGLELRRQDVSTARWSGVRAIAAQPLGGGFRFSTEIEVAVPDQPDGRGIVWPWGLMALAWRSGTGWEVAGAVEAASTPEHRYEANGLVRVSRALEVQ